MRSIGTVLLPEPYCTEIENPSNSAIESMFSTNSPTPNSMAATSPVWSPQYLNEGIKSTDDPVTNHTAYPHRGYLLGPALR